MYFRTLYWNIPGVWVISILAIWSGIVIFANYYHCDPVALKVISRYDQLMPYFIMENMSNFPGFPGLFVASVFSGSLSTLSSGFNALATVTWEDFLKQAFKNVDEKKQLWATKIIGKLITN